MAKRNQAAVNTEPRTYYAWLHIEPEAIVYETPYEVDCARLPYTARMLAAREARLSDEKFNALGRAA